MLLQENTVVADKFRLVRMIGKGGMGSVWQAEHMTLKTPCAVKFIEGELVQVAEAHARFEREAQAAAQLRSPHVVQTFDHGTWQGVPYIAMELLDGEDLGKRLAQRGGRLAAAEVCPIVQQVCRALTKAHNAGFVHRDLKPDNIFLVRDDDREIVKVLDFGVAKQTAQAIDGSNTKTGAMLGTPYYMSPEQAQGIKSVDSRSDLWSLAVIVYQCLTGRLPFESEALGDLLVKIIVSPIPTPSEVVPDVPVGFDRWWAKAASREPSQRFATAKEFADSLQLACGQSVTTDVTDRSVLKIGAIGGGTAVIPQPAHGMMNTPIPAGGVPQGTAHMQTPNPAAGSPYPTPQATTGNPVAHTFSGIGDAPTIPKKGVPVAIIGGVAAALLVVAGVVVGITVVGGKGAAAGPPEAPSASVAAPDPSVSAAPPTTAATPDPDPTSTAAAATTAAPTATATTQPTAAAQPTAVAVKAHTTTAPSAKPSATAAANTAATAAAPATTKPVATAAPAGSKPKPIKLGF
jgi:serine/threonine protein kinase